MNIKKILLFSLIIVLIPFIIISIFIKNDEITFNFSSNTIVRVYREQKKVIERVPIEEYVVGVVSGEMPINFEEEALKAQAVASRSYVMHQMESARDKDYDVVDSVTNQVYLDNEELKKNWKDDYTEKINKVKKAVLETSGEYLEYDGKVVDAMFFSTSSGYTENSEDVFSSAVPYLRSVSSNWDNISPVFEDSKTFTLKDFYSSLGLKYSEKLEIKVIETTNTGRIKKIKINDQEFSGKEICSKLKLRSTYFEIENNSNSVIIYTKGYGHGVGMSQWGANIMAKEGKSYDEILKHYYTGINIGYLKFN